VDSPLVLRERRGVQRCDRETEAVLRLIGNELHSPLVVVLPQQGHRVDDLKT